MKRFLSKEKSKFVRVMANDKKHNKPSKKSVEKTESEKIARYSKSTYFQEKDRKAIEFLKTQVQKSGTSVKAG